MRIQYTQFVADPALRGTVRDIENPTGRSLIAQGVATEIKPKTFVEFMQSNSPAAAPLTVEWGIRESDGSQFSKNMVIKKVGVNTTFYSAPPDDAPKSIKKRFAELASIDPSSAANALAEAKQKQAEYNASLQALPRHPWE